MKYIEKVKALSAVEFEHLVYDLLLLMGMGNVSWRTPGADGGRDIEGVLTNVDFSGSSTTEKWYIECKRYDAAINWPTLYQKIAYAQNHETDYLLLCTTSTPSAKCRDEIKIWNEKNLKPLVRVWDGAELEVLLGMQQALLVKYKLDDVVIERSSALNPILTELAKTVQQLYGGFVAELDNNSDVIEYAAALSEFSLLVSEKYGFDRVFRDKAINVERDIYEWCVLDKLDEGFRWDVYSLRVLLTLLKNAGRLSNIKLDMRFDGSGIPYVRLYDVVSVMTDYVLKNFNMVVSLSFVEFKYDGGDIVLTMMDK